MTMAQCVAMETECLSLLPEVQASYWSGNLDLEILSKSTGFCMRYSKFMISRLFLNFEITLCVRKIWVKWKNFMYKIILTFNVTIVWENSVQIGWLVTEMQNFGQNVCSIFYINLVERYDQYGKKFISIQNKFSFWFYVSISSSVWIGPLNEKLKMFDTFLPIFMAPKCVMGGFSSGAKFCP